MVFLEADGNAIQSTPMRLAHLEKKLCAEVDVSEKVCAATGSIYLKLNFSNNESISIRIADHCITKSKNDVSIIAIDKSDKFLIECKTADNYVSKPRLYNESEAVAFVAGYVTKCMQTIASKVKGKTDKHSEAVVKNKGAVDMMKKLIDDVCAEKEMTTAEKNTIVKHIGTSFKMHKDPKPHIRQIIAHKLTCSKRIKINSSTAFNSIKDDCFMRLSSTGWERTLLHLRKDCPMFEKQSKCIQKALKLYIFGSAMSYSQCLRVLEHNRETIESLRDKDVNDIYKGMITFVYPAEESTMNYGEQ